MHVDKRSVALRKVPTFSIRVKVGKLAKGKHLLRVDAADVAGKKLAITRTFKRCITNPLGS